MRVSLNILVDRPLYYGACPVSLERFDGSSWRPVAASPALCAPALSILPPRGAKTEAFVLDASSQAGIYRAVFAEVYESDSHTLLPREIRASNPFELP